MLYTLAATHGDGRVVLMTHHPEKQQQVAEAGTAVDVFADPATTRPLNTLANGDH